MAFLSSLSLSSPKAPIRLITTTFDDISTVANGQAIMEKLSTPGENNIYERENKIISGVLHSYQVRSINVIDAALNFITKGESDVNRNFVSYKVHLILYYISITFILITPFLLLSVIPGGFLQMKNRRLLTLKRAEKNKLLRFLGFLWVPSLIVGLLLPAVMFISPLDKPFFSIDFLIFYGGFGLLSYFLMNRRKLIPLDQKILKSFKLTKPDFSLSSLSYAFLFLLGVVAIKVSGYAMIIPRLSILIWYFTFAFLLYLGFSILYFYQSLIITPKSSLSQRLMWLFVKYLPFLLLSIVFLSIGSYSGIIGKIETLVFLSYSIFAGKAISKLTHTSSYEVIMVALIMAIPGGALF